MMGVASDRDAKPEQTKRFRPGVHKLQVWARARLGRGLRCQRPCHCLRKCPMFTPVRLHFPSHENRH